jgi:hypothetical protein
MGQVKISVQEDIDWYLYLCKKYGEEPQKDEQGINPYSNHAYELKERLRRENGY